MEQKPPVSLMNPDTGAVSAGPPLEPKSRFSAKWLVVVVLLCLGGIAFGATKLIGSGGSTKPTPTPSVQPGISSSARAAIGDLPSVGPTVLQVTQVIADQGQISTLQAKTLQVTANATIGGNVAVTGNGAFTGSITAASLAGNGAGISGVNAALLGGHASSYYTNAANLQGTLADTQLSANVALRNAPNTFSTTNTFTAGLNAAGTTTFSGPVVVSGSTSLTGTTTISSLILSSPLSVPNGGTGLSSIPVNGVVFGQGSAPLATAVPSAAGQCLVSTSLSLQFGSCTGSGGGGVTALDTLSGALVIANSTAAGTTVTLNDASTSAKGIASFNATNFSVAGGIVNTTQNLAVASSPTFAGLTLSAPLAVASGGTGSTSLTANGVVIGQGTGALITVSAGGAGQCLVSNAGAPSFQSCPGSGGVISVNSQSGTISVANASAAGGVITINNATTAAKGIASFSATDLTVNSGVVDTIQSIAVGSTPTFAGLSLTSALTVGNGGTGATTAPAARASLGAAASGANSDITSLTGLATALTVAQGGTGVTTASNGQILIGTGGGLSLNTLSAGAGINIANASGTITISAPGSGSCAGCANTALSNLASVALNTSLLPVSAGSANLGSGVLPFGQLSLAGTSSTPATNNFLVTGASTGGTRTITLPDASGTIAVSASGNIALSPTTGALSFTGLLPIANGGTNANSATSARTNLGAAASGANSDITSLTALTTALTIAEGGTGSTSSGGARTALGAAASGSNSDITSLGGLTTALSVGQGGTGVTTAANGQILIGTGGGLSLNTLTAGSGVNISNASGSITISAPSSGSCASCANTNLSNLGTVALNTSLLPGAAGAENLGSGTLPFGSLSLSGSSGTPATNNFLITGASTGGTRTLTLPDASGTVAVSTSGPLSLDSAGNLTCSTCLTSGGGGSGGVSSINSANGALTLQGASAGSVSTAGTTITINDASYATKGLASFSSTDFSVSSGAVDTVQSIAVGATPTFAGLNLTSALSVSNGGTGSGTAGGARTALGAAASGGNSDITSLSGLTTALSVAQGGTGVTTASNGQILIGTGGGFSLNTLSAGSGINITNGSGTITISSPNAGSCAACANTALSNLSGVAINTSLLPATAGTPNLGSGTLPFGQLSLAGTSGTPATNNFLITGASTGGTRTITLPDASGTVCLQTSSGCGFESTTGNDFVQNTLTYQSGANFNIGGTGIGGSLEVVAGSSNGFDVSSTGILNIGDTYATTLNIGSNAAAHTIAIGNGAAAQAVTLGSTNTTSSLTLQAGSTGISINGNTLVTGTLGGSSTINAVSGYKFNGTAGSSTTCSSGNVLQNAVVSGGIITAGTCVANGGGTAPTLQNVYDNSSTTPVITLSSTGNGLFVDDAPSTVGGNLFAVQNNAGSTQYLAVTTGGISVAGTGSATTAFKAPSIDASSGTLSVGTSVATAISVGQSGVITTDNGSFTAAQLLTASLTGGNAIAITGAPTNSATSSLVRIGGAIASGNAAANGGTYIGLNAPSSGAGSAADLVNLQHGGSSVFQVDSGGNLTLGGGNSTISSDELEHVGYGGTSYIGFSSCCGTTIYDPNEIDLSGSIVVTHNVTDIDSAPVAAATYGLLNVGSTAISGGNAVTNGGTYVAINEPSSGAGTAADYLNLQHNGSNRLLVDNAGDIANSGYVNAAGGYKNNGTAGSTTTCSSGNVLQNAVVSGGIITAGTCVANGGGTAPTLQNVYDNSATTPIITLSTASGGGIAFKDASSSVGGNLFAVQNNAGTTNYLAVTTGGASVTGTFSASTSLLTPTVDTISAGTLNLGTSTATAISIAKTGVTTTVNGTFNTATAANGTTFSLGGAVYDGCNILSQCATTITAGGGERITLDNGNADNDITLYGPSISSSLSASLTSFEAYGGAASATVPTAIIQQGTTPGSAAHALEIQDASSNVNSFFNNTGAQLTLGRISGSGTVTQGKLIVSDGTTDNFGLTLQSATLTSAQTITLPNATGTVALTNDTADFIDNQNSVTQTANLKISGSAQVGSLQVVAAGTVDAASGTLNIGTTNASTVNIATNAAAHTVGIATSSASAQAVSVGSTNTGSTLTLGGGSGITLQTTNSTASVIIKDTTNGTGVFQVQDSSGNAQLNFDTSGDALTVGYPGGSNGVIGLTNSSNSNQVDLETGTTTGTYAISLPTAIGSGGQCLSVASIAGANEQLGYGTCSGGGGGGVTLQATTPGTADTGNLNISGTGIFGTAVKTNTINASGSSAGMTLGSNLGSGTITIGASSQSGSITIGGSSASGNLFIGGSSASNSIYVGGLSASSTIYVGGLSGTSSVEIGISTSNQNIDVGDGAAVKTVTLGSSTSTSSTLIQSGSGNLSLQTNSSTSGVIDKAVVDSTTAFQVQNSGGTPLFTVDTVNSQVTVTGLIANVSLTVNGHVITGNSSGSTTASVNAHAGTGGSPSCTISGNDTGGQVTLVTGTSAWASGVQCTVTFANGYSGSAPHPVITSANGTDTSSVKPYVNVPGTSPYSTFTISFINADSAQHTYVFNYFNAQ